MIKLMLALRDNKAELFMQPFFVPTVGVAYRNLMDEMQRGGEDNPLARHPQDYEVWQLGIYDDETGAVLQEEGSPNKLVDVAALGTSVMDTQASVRSVN